MKIRGASVVRCLLQCVVLVPLLLSPVRGQGLSPFIEELAQKPESWKVTPLPGKWTVLSPSRKEAASAEPLFGSAAQRVVVTEDGGMPTRVDVLLMERGAAAADDAFLRSMREAASKASAGVQAKLGKPGQMAKPMAGAAAGTVVQEWATGAATVRLTLEPGSRLYVSIVPLQASAAPTAAGTPAKPSPLKSRVMEKPNGDVIITSLPEVAPVDGTLGYILEAAQCLAGYYGWTMNVQEVATAAGWTPDGSEDKTYEVMGALAKEAKVEWTQQNIIQMTKNNQQLDLLEIRRWIDRGRPVVYRHLYSEVREAFLLDFNKQYEQNPKLELPSPKDPAEKSRWLHWTENSNFYGVSALLIGYNKKRGEFIIKYPGNEAGSQIIRVREEELAASLLQIYYISPN